MNTTNLKQFKNNFFFISDEKLFTMLNFNAESYRFLAYEELVNSLDPITAAKHKRPVPTFAYDSWLYEHIVKIYARTIFGKKFSEDSYIYSFFFGFYLFIIWKLGGGRRLLPLISTYQKCNYYGFYDLHFTPLAFVLSLKPTLNWAAGASVTSALGLEYFKYYNVHSVWYSPLSEAERDAQLSDINTAAKNSYFFFRADILRFVVLAVFLKILFFIPVFFVHFFVRPAFFWLNFFIYYFTKRSRLSKYPGSLPYDYLWKKVYFSHFWAFKQSTVLKEQNLSYQVFTAKELELIGFTYSDVALEDNRVFNLLIYRLGVHFFRGYAPDSFSSFFSGYYVTRAIAQPSVQLTALKNFSFHCMEEYKRKVLQHALSIRPAVVSAKSVYNSWAYTVTEPEQGLYRIGQEDRDFFVFVRRFNMYVYYSIQAVKLQKISPAFTSFYSTLKRRSRFIQIFDFRFSVVLFRILKQIGYAIARVFLSPFFVVITLLSSYSFSNLKRKFDKDDRTVSGSLLRFSSRFVTTVQIFFTFPLSIFKFLKLYFYLFLEYFVVLFRIAYDFFKKFSYFNAYYSYFYFFRRYFHSFFFMRFFTREVEEELDQMMDPADLSDEFDEEEFGSMDFEFENYDVGFEKPLSFDEYDTFYQDTYYDKSFTNQDTNSHFFNDDRRTGNNLFFEQLFWGWFSITYSEFNFFLFSRPKDYERLKAVDYSPDSLSDSEFEEQQLLGNYGLDDEQYSTEEEQLEEEDYEEFYYDPEFLESFGRYYEYVLKDKALVELNNKFLAYRLKLGKWHQSISKNFVPIPKEFLLIPSHLRQPTSATDWKILTLVISTLILNESQDQVFSARNDIEFMNNVWSKFAKAIRLHPEKVYDRLDSPDFDRRFELIEKQFSKLSSVDSSIDKFFRLFFGPHIAEKLKPIFYTILTDFRARLGWITNYSRVDFSLLDKIYLSFTSPNTLDSEALSYFKIEFSRISRFDVLSIIFYLRFLADSDFASFYKFINTPVGSFIWSRFENSFNLATKYSPKSYDFVTYDPLALDMDTVLDPEYLFSLYLETSDDNSYSYRGFTMESLFTYSIRSIYSLFNVPYEGVLADNPVPRPGHPANVFGAGFDDEESWNVIPDLSTTGPTSNINLASTIFSDFVYEYFTDPSVAVTLFPFSYIDFIEDVTEVDEVDTELDIDDQYIFHETDVSTLDSISFYVNEDFINDDVFDELDTFDPTDNQDDAAFMTDPAVFNTDDTEASGDLPFYDNDLELWIDDNLEGGEDWEPEELESVDDVSVPINRLFFGTLVSSSTIFPATDYRLYSGLFSKSKHVDTGYDLDYLTNLKLAYSSKSTKSLAISQHSYIPTRGSGNSTGKVVSAWALSLSFILSHIIRLYFYVIAFLFNITFYTYSKDIYHLKNALILKHFSKNASTYRAPLDFSSRLKSWIYGYEDFYHDKEHFARFKDNFLDYGDTYQGPRSNMFDRGFLSFGHHIPFSDFLFFNDRDAEYEMTDFLVHSQQDYVDFDNLRYIDTVDLFDNSRFTEVDELEFFHMDLEESAPLDGLLHEEQDWDIGTLYSYSSDDFIEDIQMFNNRVSIFISALSSLFSLISDYYLYFFKVKINKYIFNPFYYWNIRSSYEWARLAATYGLSVYIIRYFFSIAIIFSVSIYSYFVFPRIFYWFFVHTLDYGFFLFANAIFTFFVFFFSWLVFFPNFANFYSNFSKDEKLSFYWLIIAIWIFYVFSGYARFPWLPLVQDAELFQNQGTEPDISPEPFSREYQGDMNNPNVESDRSITFFDIRRERDLVYDSEKLPIDYNRRLIAFTFDYRGLNFGTFIDAIKYNILGIRNSYFTGYKYTHTNYDFMFTRHIIDAYHSYIHRHYMVNLGGLPRRYARVIKRQTLKQFDRIRALDVAYSYSVALGSKDEIQAVDPTNYIIEDVFSNHNDSVPDYPYDFRPDSFYNSTDDYYSQLYTPRYGSASKVSRELTAYNIDYVAPRKRIIFYKARRYSRYNYEGNGRKRRLSTYVYRYGRLSRFGRYRRRFAPTGTASVSTYFYSQVLKHRYVQSSIKKGQFLFDYSTNFSKFVLFRNFSRAKGYIDIFTFRPSHLYPRSSRRRGHSEGFHNFYSTVEALHHASIYSEFTIEKSKFDEVKEIISEEGYIGNWAKYTTIAARLDYSSKYRTFYKQHVSRLAIKSKNPKSFYRPFFNFLRYSRFVHSYNNHIIMLYPHIKDNYYLALTRFADKYLMRVADSTSYLAYLAGSGTYQSKFKYSPLIQSKFSRDPKQVIRKKYYRDSKDLFVSTSKRFSKIRTPVDVFYSNYSYKLKHYPRRVPLQKKNSRNRDRQLYQRKLYFYRRLPLFRQRYKKFFSNIFRYRTLVRRKRFYRRRLKRRFFPKTISSVRYQNIFNNYRVYRDRWLYGLKSFNKTVASESKAIEAVREHELKFKVAVKKLGDKIPITAVTDRLEVKPYTLPVDFLTDFSNIRKPIFSYYRFSPVNYAFSSLQFKLLKSEDKLPQSLFQFSGFDRDDNFEQNQDVRIMTRAISVIGDFNRVRLFKAKKRFYKPYFYRYLEVSADRKYKSRRLFLALKKQLSEEFILSMLLPPIDTKKRAIQPQLSKKFLVHHSVLRVRDPKDPEKFVTYKRLKKVVPKKVTRESRIRYKYEDWYKRRFARLVYNWQKRSRPRTKRNILIASRYYSRIGDRYDIGDYKAYVRRYKPRRPLIYFENRFFGPRYNEMLGEAETLLAKEKRRKKAALKRLREKKKRALELAKAKQKRLALRQAEKRKKAVASSGSPSPVDGGSDLPSDTTFGFEKSFKDPFFDHDDDPTKFLCGKS